MEINYGGSCGCKKEIIPICIKCELYDSLKIANAFEKSGYTVIYKHCKKHTNQDQSDKK